MKSACFLPLSAAVLCTLGCSTVPTQGGPTKVGAACEQYLCRKPSVRLNIGTSAPFSRASQTPVPFLQRDLVSVFPGETVFILASIDGGILVLQRATSTNTDSAKTLVFSLSQLPGKQDMVLEVFNPFPADIKFEMGYMSPVSEKIYGTSSCPVAAGLKLFEHWPYPIFQVLLRQPKVLAAAEPHNCI